MGGEINAPQPSLWRITETQERDHQIFAMVREVLRGSNCVKTKTAAAIVRDDSIVSVGTDRAVIISTGNNMCAPAGHQYGDALSECPRMAIKTGTNYELCSPVHAEVMSALNIRGGRTTPELAKFAGHLMAPDGHQIVMPREEIRAAFTGGELQKLSGAYLYLVGHYWACDPCVGFLDVVGIPKANIKFDKVTGEATRAAYESRGITNPS